MSMTKREFHDEICALAGDFDEAEYWAFPPVNECAIDWFPDRRLAHDGYGENEASSPANFSDDDLPF